MYHSIKCDVDLFLHPHRCYFTTKTSQTSSNMHTRRFKFKWGQQSPTCWLFTALLHGKCLDSQMASNIYFAVNITDPFISISLAYVYALYSWLFFQGHSSNSMRYSNKLVKRSACAVSVACRPHILYCWKLLDSPHHSGLPLDSDFKLSMLALALQGW
jgi:hypothetical protein